MRLTKAEIKQRSELFRRGLKMCRNCSGIRELSSFARNNGCWKGLAGSCKTCQRERADRRTELRTEQLRLREERRVLSGLGLRRCRRCSGVRETASFTPLVKGADGLHPDCNTCRAETNRMWSRAQAEADPLFYRLDKGWTRARKAGCPAERFTPAYLRAYWDSIGLDPTVSAYSAEPLGPDFQLDHVVPLSNPKSPGHVVSNLAPCLPSENRTKHKHHYIHLLHSIHGQDAA